MSEGEWDDGPVGYMSAADLVDQSSGIEPIMVRILGTAYDRRARFLRAASLEEAIERCSEPENALLAHEVAVFPQLPIGRFRPDFTVVVRRRGSKRVGTEHIFLVECDGALHHGPANFAADRERELEILRSTGLPMLRFSGAEITYGANLVEEIVSAQIEMMLLDQGDGSASLAEAITRLRHRLSVITEHPLMRGTFLRRNALTYDPADIGADDEFDAPIDKMRHSLQSLRALDVEHRQAVYDAAFDQSLHEKGYAVCVDAVTGEQSIVIR